MAQRQKFVQRLGLVWLAVLVVSLLAACGGAPAAQPTAAPAASEPTAAPAATEPAATATETPDPNAPPVVHWSEVVIKVRHQPVYPEAAKELGIEQAKCPVRFTIDEKGAPIAIDVSECPELFRASTEEAAWKWRFYPYKRDKVPQKVTFVINFNYLLK